MTTRVLRVRTKSVFDGEGTTKGGRKRVAATEEKVTIKKEENDEPTTAEIKISTKKRAPTVKPSTVKKEESEESDEKASPPASFVARKQESLTGAPLAAHASDADTAENETKAEIQKFPKKRTAAVKTKKTKVEDEEEGRVSLPDSVATESVAPKASEAKESLTGAPLVAHPANGETVEKPKMAEIKKKRPHAAAKSKVKPKKEKAEEEDGEVTVEKPKIAEIKKKRPHAAAKSKVKPKKEKIEEEDGEASQSDAATTTASAASKRVYALGERPQEAVLRETEGAKVLAAAIGSRKMLGFHASASGSAHRAIHDARSLGARAFALFVRNQRTWKVSPMEEGVVEAWKRDIEATSFPVEQILPHGSYLVNPGAPDAEKLQKSRDTMLAECVRAERLGITMFNFHPGSSCGITTREECIATVAATIDFVLVRTKSICLVVETMAAQGHTVGGTFEEIRDILASVKGDAKRVGVCIDTCHIFAAGYDIRTRAAYDKTMEKFASIVGFDRLRALHLNDSKSGLGSHLDRHEHIGEGEIGLEAFRCIMNDERFDGIPMILETPEGDYPQEMRLLYGLDEKTAKGGKKATSAATKK